MAGVRTKLIVDCDPGHDDAVALLFAARHFDLLAVTTVFGNAVVENTTRNTLAILELAGIDAPVATGCSEPLVAPAVHSREMHGKTGLDGADIPAPTRSAIETHAVDLIIALAEQHRGELVVAAIGPNTNLALALKREPRLRSWLREVTIMGGSATLGTVTPVAEFNIHADPEAAAVVFESGIPIRMVGYDVTRQIGFDRDDIARLRESGRKTAAVIADLMSFSLTQQERVFGLPVAPVHDVCALVPYVVASVIRTVETSVKVELTGTYTRGMTVCDLRSIRPGADAGLEGVMGPNARVAVEARSRPLMDLVIDTILAYD